jgi:S-DNA-T family DNA segregation ATPase FtsK/SpoIIIE
VPFPAGTFDLSNQDSPLRQGHFRVTTRPSHPTPLQNQGLIWARYGLMTLAMAIGAVILTAALVLVVWWWQAPVSFAVRIGQPVRGWWRWHTVYRPGWRDALHAVRLLDVRDEYEHLPTVRTVRSNSICDVLTIRLASGQTPDDLAAAGEGLRHVWGAYRAAVTPLGPGWCQLRFFHTDPLTTPITPVDLPPLTGLRHEPTGADCLEALSRLQLGRSEDGTPWRLDLVATHVLVAGATGSGKGSVLWSIVRLLAPWIRAGLVKLVVIDPKGGMEFAFGKPLFSAYCDGDHNAMVHLLEQTADAMDARTHHLAGITRTHTPTTEDPFTVVLVDEVADLTAHAPDTATKKRAASAISRLLAKGRAPGFCLIAAALDPRKEVLPFRDLFPTRIALRLREPDQVDLVLGDGALDRGADCSAIPRTLPGIGYIHQDTATDPHPIRVRASWVTDAEIARLCHLYGPPTPAAILTPAPALPVATDWVTDRSA